MYCIPLFQTGSVPSKICASPVLFSFNRIPDLFYYTDLLYYHSALQWTCSISTRRYIRPTLFKFSPTHCNGPLLFLFSYSFPHQTCSIPTQFYTGLVLFPLNTASVLLLYCTYILTQPLLEPAFTEPGIRIVPVLFPFYPALDLF
jgi:hypothetical protein